MAAKFNSGVRHMLYRQGFVLRSVRLLMAPGESLFAARSGGHLCLPEQLGNQDRSAANRARLKRLAGRQHRRLKRG